MGLDMNLYGDKSTWKDTDTVDGYSVSSIVLDLGYWRKHPNLHGFIVKTFADDKDECQRIRLDAEDLHNIIVALQTDAIYNEPVTGFFFGKSYFPGEKDEHYSYEEQKDRDIHIFTRAHKWLLGSASNDELRSVYYQASW
jgi:hypothetical protein